MPVLSSDARSCDRDHRFRLQLRASSFRHDMRRSSSETARAMTITNQLLLVIAFTLLTVAILPTTKAVVPPPDGGYPGANTAEGESALLSLTTGTFNTAVGFFALKNND